MSSCECMFCDGIYAAVMESLNITILFAFYVRIAEQKAFMNEHPSLAIGNKVQLHT